MFLPTQESEYPDTTIFNGVGGVPNRSGYFGGSTQRLRARGDICHLAHFTVPALRTAILGQGAVIFSRVAQQN